MKNFESYHVIPFLLAYLSLNNSYNFNTPVINITKTVYSIISLAPLIGVLALTDSDSVEHLLLVLSYAFAQRSLGSLVVLNNDKPPKVTLSNYLHIVFLISILMLVYNKKINIAFFDLEDFSNKKKTDTFISDKNYLILLPRKKLVSSCASST